MPAHSEHFLSPPSWDTGSGGGGVISKGGGLKFIPTTLATTASGVTNVAYWDNFHRLTEEQQDIVFDLYRAVKAATVPNWDGEGASAVAEKAHEWAEVFVRNYVPKRAGEPIIYVDSDGDPCFEWIADTNHRFLASVNSSGRLIFSRIAGDSCTKGNYDLPTIEFEGLGDELKRLIGAISERR